MEKVDIITCIVGFIFLASVFINLALGFKLYQVTHEKKKPDANAQEILSELFSGPVVLRIELIEKNSIMQWRAPR